MVDADESENDSDEEDTDADEASSSESVETDVSTATSDTHSSSQENVLFSNCRRPMSPLCLFRKSKLLPRVQCAKCAESAVHALRTEEFC